MRVRSLGREDPLEEGMATHSSILAWRIPWTGELGGLQSMQSQNWTRRKQLGMHAHNVFKLLKTGDVGTPLAVHWLRLHTSKAKGASLIPGQGTKRLPRGSVVKNLPANAGDAGSIPGSGRSPGGGNGNPLQYSCLENSMDRGAWQATVHGVTKSRTRLSD